MEKLTKQVRKNIAKVAKQLPPMQHKKQTVKVVYHGATLLRAGKSEDSRNNPIDINKRYLSSDTPKEVNHRKEMERLYCQFGNLGIIQYVDSVHNATVANGN